MLAPKYIHALIQTYRPTDIQKKLLTQFHVSSFKFQFQFSDFVWLISMKITMDLPCGGPCPPPPFKNSRIRLCVGLLYVSNIVYLW